MVTFLTQIDPIHMRQDTELSYFCGASLFCGAAVNIRTLQQRWRSFNSFQMAKECKTQFILNMKGIGSILKRWVPSYFLRNLL